VRAKTSLATAGLGNPVVSTGETTAAIGFAVAAIVIPLLCLLGLVVLLIWLGRKARRMMLQEAS
jgi:hypothetical protein